MISETVQSSMLAGMPIGRRTPRGKRRWYLVHAPGREQATCDKLLKVVSPELLEDAFVLRKESWRKHDGEWRCCTVPLYRDYFFVVTRDVLALSKELSKLSFPAQIARGEGSHFAPFAHEAQEWYEQMMDADHVIRSSQGVILDGKLQLREGPLVGQEASVIKVNRPRRFCFVSVDDGANGMRERMPLVIPFKS